MKVKKDAKKILDEFSKALENIPKLDETYYIVDNTNRTRPDVVSKTKNPTKLLKNAKTNEKGEIIVERGKWLK